MGLEAAKDCIPLVNAEFGGRERRLEFEAFKIKVKKNSRKCFDLSYICRQFTLASLWKSNWSETRTKKKEDAVMEVLVKGVEDWIGAEAMNIKRSQWIFKIFSR